MRRQVAVFTSAALALALAVTACANESEDADTGTSAAHPENASASVFCKSMQEFDDVLGALESEENTEANVQQAVTISADVADAAPEDVKAAAQAFASGWTAIEGEARKSGYDASQISAEARQVWDNPTTNKEVAELVDYATENCGQTYEQVQGTSAAAPATPAATGGGAGGGGSDEGGGSGGGDEDDGGGSGGGEGGPGGGCGHGGWDGYGGGGCS